MTEFGEGHHLQLVDGFGYVFRAFFQAERSLAQRYRYRSDGTPVGAVHFYCNMLFKHIINADKADDRPTHAAVAFDTSAATFRSEIFPEYKAHRPPAPEDLVPQFPATKEATTAFNIACVELDGYEADDIIATLAIRARDAGARVTILSSDKDLMQLVGDGIRMIDARKDAEIGPEQVRDKFGVDPERVVDVQALAGDSVDNVPGAPGIGVKTAAQLINDYGDLESLLRRADEIKQPKRRETLINFADQIRVSRKLVELDRNVPINISAGDLEIARPAADRLMDFLLKQEFRTLTKRAAGYLGIEPPAVPERKEPSQERVAAQQDVKERADKPFEQDSYECVQTEESLHRWIEEIRERGVAAVDTETTGLDEMRAELVGISLALEPGKACYIPVGHTRDDPSLLESENRELVQLDRETVLNGLRPILEDRSILKVGHNIKYDMKILARCGIRMDPVDDTMLIAYALHGGKHRFAMDYLSKEFLGHEPIPIKSLIGSGKSQISFDKVQIEKAAKYASEDADITLRLWSDLKPKLHSGRVTSVYETLERPLIPVLAGMERDGIKVDRHHLAIMSQEFDNRIQALAEEIHRDAGQAFNIASPKQLGEILFGKLELPGGRKLKTGNYATGADILEDLAAEGHELPGKVLDWRHMSKLKSTYTDSLQQHVNPETQRVHTSYNIAGANTGRLASNDPNLQNIPVRTDEGRRIREAFIAEDGHVLVSLDYSQVELRVLAHVANIESLREAFEQGLDIHAMTASQMFGVPIEGMDPSIRRQAKAINFGVIYGISGFGLARNLRIPRAVAQEFIDKYFERFPGIRAYMDQVVEEAMEKEFVTTIFGRKIHTPAIREKGAHGAFAKRAAINAPIQGSAADLIRRAMIRIPPVIEEMPAKMLLQVHDELIFEVRKDAVEDVITAVRKVMENADGPAAQIKPSLVVEAGFGSSWAEAH